MLKVLQFDFIFADSKPEWAIQLLLSVTKAKTKRTNRQTDRQRDVEKNVWRVWQINFEHHNDIHFLPHNIIRSTPFQLLNKFKFVRFHSKVENIFLFISFQILYVCLVNKKCAFVTNKSFLMLLAFPFSVSRKYFNRAIHFLLKTNLNQGPML